jgi:hypothetical protein
MVIAVAVLPSALMRRRRLALVSATTKLPDFSRVRPAGSWRASSPAAL